MDYLYHLVDLYHAFLDANAWIVPLAAFLLPIVEALVPTLPLTALVTVNLTAMSAAYGPAAGTILTIVLSVLGSFSGMFGIFLVIRKTFGERYLAKIEQSPFGRKFANVAAAGNTGLLLTLLCNPILPSSLMNYALSFTNIRIPRYVLLTGVSRIVIIVLIVFLGSVFNVQEHPLNVLWILLGYGILFLFGLLYKKFSVRK